MHKMFLLMNIEQIVLVKTSLKFKHLNKAQLIIVNQIINSLRYQRVVN